MSHTSRFNPYSLREATLVSIPVELLTAIADLLPRHDALQLALTCWRLRAVALPIIHREISISPTASGFRYKRKLLRKPKIRKRLRTLRLRLDAPEADSERSSKLLTWIFEGVEFRSLENFSIAISFIYLKVWRDMFAFLNRHPALRNVCFDFRSCEEYQEYDHIEDRNGLWTPITPALLPSLQSLTVDPALLAVLANRGVASLGQLAALHIIDCCMEDQEEVWEIIHSATHLFGTIETLSLTHGPLENPSAFYALWQHFAPTFTGVQHLSTNIGEGLWTAEIMDDLVYNLQCIYSLDIPVSVARDALTYHDDDEVQATEGTQVVEPYSLEADAAFRMTVDIQSLTNELTRALQVKSPVQEITLHMPGWSPALSLSS